jgi:hypothetical protein
MLSTSNEALVRYCDVISSWFPVCAQEQIAMANDAKKENVFFILSIVLVIYFMNYIQQQVLQDLFHDRLMAGRARSAS